MSRHLEKGTPASAAFAYLQQVKRWAPFEPVIHIDDSDVVKPDGYKFESLGIVKNSSESTSTKNVYKKGYHVTEACVLTSSNHPVSIFPKYILHTRKIISLQIPLLIRLWNKVPLSLARQLLLWTVATMIIKCF